VSEQQTSDEVSDVSDPPIVPPPDRPVPAAEEPNDPSAAQEADQLFELYGAEPPTADERYEAEYTEAIISMCSSVSEPAEKLFNAEVSSSAAEPMAPVAAWRVAESQLAHLPATVRDVTRVEESVRATAKTVVPDTRRSYIHIDQQVQPSSEPTTVGAYTVRFDNGVPIVEHQADRSDQTPLLWYARDDGEVRFIDPDFRQRYRLVAEDGSTRVITETRHTLGSDDVAYTVMLARLLENHSDLLTAAAYAAGITTAELGAIWDPDNARAARRVESMMHVGRITGRVSEEMVNELAISVATIHFAIATGTSFHDPFTDEENAVRLRPVMDRIHAFYVAVATSWEPEEPPDEQPLTTSELTHGEVASAIFETLVGDPPTESERVLAAAAREVVQYMTRAGIILFRDSLAGDKEDLQAMRPSQMVRSAELQLADIPRTIEAIQGSITAMREIVRYATVHADRPVAARYALPESVEGSYRVGQFIVRNYNGTLMVATDSLATGMEDYPDHLPCIHPDGTVQIIHPDNTERYLLRANGAGIDVVREVIHTVRMDGLMYLERLSRLFRQQEHLLLVCMDGSLTDEQRRMAIGAGTLLINRAIAGDMNDTEKEATEGQWLGLRPVVRNLLSYINAMTGDDETRR
jgi:hypothetical protein